MGKIRQRVIILLRFSVFVLLLIFNNAFENFVEQLSVEDEDGNLSFDANYLVIIYNFVIFITGLSSFKDLLRYLYRQKKGKDFRDKDNFLLGIKQIYSIILVVGVILTVLSFFEVEFSTLFTSLSVIAAAIAIVSRDYIASLISGMIITFSNQISIDDFVKIGDNKGKIIDFTLTKIHLLNEDDDLIYIPTNNAFASEIINYSRRPVRKISIDFEIDLKHLDDVDSLEAYLYQSLKEFHDEILPESFNIRVVEIKKDSVTLKFQYILRKQDRELERLIRKRTVRNVVRFVSNKNG